MKTIEIKKRTTVCCADKLGNPYERELIDGETILICKDGMTEPVVIKLIE